jgi:hypothetical protein
MDSHSRAVTHGQLIQLVGRWLPLDVGKQFDRGIPWFRRWGHLRIGAPPERELKLVDAVPGPMPVGDVENQNVRGQIGPATATNLDIERREQTLKIGRLEVAALGSSIARQVRMQPLRTGSDGEHDDPLFEPGRSVADS